MADDGYSKWQVHDVESGDLVGYVGTHDDCMAIVQDIKEAVDCKWEVRDTDKYFATSREPQDRWLGVANYNYAGWGLIESEYSPVTLNRDGTISLKDKDDVKLYGPYQHLGTPYVCWSDGTKNDNILRFSKAK